MADKDIPADNGVGVERHDHGVLMPSSSSAKDHLEGTATPLVWNASCVPCSKGKRKCDGLRPCRYVCSSHRLIAFLKNTRSYFSLLKRYTVDYLPGT